MQSHSKHVYGTPEQRFWPKVEKTDTCWLWTGAVMKNGYGVFSERGLAHHFLVGKPASGMEWDHLCYVRKCVRPEHLELVTRAENVRRQRTHGTGPKAVCKHGHPFDEANTRVLRDGRRACKTCTREAMRRYRANHPDYH